MRRAKIATLMISALMMIFLALIFAAPTVSASDTIHVPDDYSTIQEAINNAKPGDTIEIAAGTYDEQLVIDESLTLQGAGDTTIIQPSGPELMDTPSIPWIGSTKAMSAIVSVETTGGIVTVKNLKIDGSLITSKATTWVGGLVYLETSGKVEGVTVIGNSALPDRTAGIFAAAIANPASLEVTGCTVIGYNRAGIYALGGKFTADYHHNEINGPGSISTGVPNGMFFLEGATGSATYNTVTDLGYTGVGEYRSTGIGTYNAGVVVFGHNEISYVQNAFALSTGTIGTTVEYNTIHDCHTGVRIEANATDSIIQFNDIYNNDFAMRCGATMGDGNEAHNNNFVNNSGAEWTNAEEAEPNTYVGVVSNVHPTYILDATYNWWETTDGSDIFGMVSAGVDFTLWIDAPYPEGMTTEERLLEQTAQTDDEIAELQIQIDELQRQMEASTDASTITRLQREVTSLEDECDELTVDRDYWMNQTREVRITSDGGAETEQVASVVVSAIAIIVIMVSLKVIFKRG